MMIFPAIDLRQGRCVRLVEGKIDRETVYSHDPAGMARHWEEMGAEFLHLVDLDGAFSGFPQNLSVVKEIIDSIRIPVQLGGGIRTMETVEMLLEEGVHRVILGTAAISDADLVARACDKYGERIVIGIDSKKGLVAIEGWEATSAKTALELALEMKAMGVARVIYTDIGRDGTLKGANVEATGELARKSGLKVIASGGVSSLDDIRAIKNIEESGIEGVILGKVLYSQAVDLREALKVAKGEM